jgi:hypothetical protein
MRGATITRCAAFTAGLVICTTALYGSQARGGQVFPMVSYWPQSLPTPASMRGDSFEYEELLGGYVNHAQPWTPTLDVSIIDYYETPNGLTAIVSKDVSGGVLYNAPAIDITPFTPVGLPAGFNIEYLSPNEQWFTDGTRLYTTRVPEPQAMVLLSGAVMVCAAARCLRGPRRATPSANGAIRQNQNSSQ